MYHDGYLKEVAPVVDIGCASEFRIAAALSQI
jgi:hypothetical protein